ncbi:MAG: hypothetical protein PVI90_10665 [Desulfobacteraceae bacterium]|jgi:aspartokinase
MGKISINGLKLSSELVLLQLESSTNVEDSLAKVCRVLGDNSINILFISTTTSSGDLCGILCIDSGKKHHAQQLISQLPNLKNTIKITSSVGLLTLFPHQSNLKLVAVVMQQLGENKIPIYGMGSSIAAITFVIDFHRLDDAAKVLLQCLEMPQSATPMKSRLKIRQVQKR